MENGMANDIGIELINYLTSSNFLSFVHALERFLLMYFLLCIITLIPSLYMMYKKENIKPWYSLIPIFNLYHYFKIVKIPYYLVFIPIVNIITIYISNYRLSNEYNTETYIRILSFIVPFITTPYIIFSNKYNLTKKVDKRLLRTVHDVDKMEERLISENNDEAYDQSNIVQNKPIDDTYKSDIDMKINQIENNAITDDYYDDLLYMDNNQNVKKEDTKEEQLEEIKEDIADIQDIIDSNDIRVEGIASMENKIEEGNNKKIIDNANYQEYKEAEKDLSTIAFGGTQQNKKEDNYKLESKDINRCPYCNSQLDINSKICPGCGRDVSSIVFEK